MEEPSYFPTEPYRELTVFEAQPVPTVVVEAQNHPMSELPTLFDSVYSRLFPALAEAGVEILRPPSQSPFGLTFTFSDPDGYAVTVHEAGV